MVVITTIHWIQRLSGSLISHDMRATRRLAAAAVATLLAAGGACAGRGEGGPGPGDPDAAPGGADSGGSDGSSGDPDLDRACTPGLTLQVEDTDAGRAALVRDALGEPPQTRIQEIGRSICRILYREASEVRDATHLTLYLRYEPGEVAWKAGNGADIEVMISTDHIANVDRAGRDVAREVQGILFHEMTHMYQHDDSDEHGADGGLIEGIADFVRFKAGYAPDGARPDPDGNWNDGYRTTAFFLVWVDSVYPDFAYRLNMSMDERDGKRWSPEAFREITGKSVDALWEDYRATF